MGLVKNRSTRDTAIKSVFCIQSGRFKSAATVAASAPIANHMEVSPKVAISTAVRYPVGAVVEVTAIQGVKLIVRERKEES